jgi:hypothetical protein
MEVIADLLQHLEMALAPYPVEDHTADTDILSEMDEA